MTLGVHIVILLGSLTVLDNLVLVVREVQFGPIAEIVADAVLPVERNLPTPAVHLTEIGVGHYETKHAGHCAVLPENVLTVLLVVVEGGAQLAVKEVDIHTVVLLEGLLPCYIGVVLGGLYSTFRCGAVLNTEVVAKSTVVHASTFQQSALVHIIGVGYVHEARGRHFVVTYKSPGSTGLQEIDYLGEGLEEGLVTDHPADGAGGEGTETLAGSKVLRAVVTEVELGHVAVLPVVGHTGHESYIRTGYVNIGLLAAKIVFLALVVEGKGGHGMVAEAAVVVE